MDEVRKLRGKSGIGIFIRKDLEERTGETDNLRLPGAKTEMEGDNIMSGTNQGPLSLVQLIYLEKLQFR